MKDTGPTARKKAEESSNSRMELNMMANIRTIRKAGKAHICGAMEESIRETG